MPAHNFQDLTGQGFGRLTVVSRAPNRGYQAFWKCQCICGNLCEVPTGDLKRHHTKSCGCYLKEVVSKNAIKHGYSNSKIYKKWKSMKERCSNPNNKFYHDYGGRGIKVCERWKKSFPCFLEDMGYPPSNKHSLERLNNNLGYFKENCKWATAKEQQRNKRNSILITYNNKTLSLSEWADSIGIRYETLRKRIFVRKWDIHMALTTPTKLINPVHLPPQP